MSGPAVLLDSVILIDHLNGVEAATAFLEQVGPTGCISAISFAEVLTGIAPGARRTVARLLDRFHFVPIDRDIADLAATLRSKHR
jgi:predicted nucleic acid-binding protein